MGFEHIGKHDDSNYLIASGMGYLLFDMDKVKNIQPKIAIDKILLKDNFRNLFKSQRSMIQKLILKITTYIFTTLPTVIRNIKTSNTNIGWKDMIIFGVLGQTELMFHIQIYPVDLTSFLFVPKLETKSPSQFVLILKLNRLGICRDGCTQSILYF